MKSIIYYFLLIIIFFVSIDLIMLSLKKCPKKIKGTIITIMMFIIINKISLIVLAIINDSNLAIYMKYFVDLDYIYMPCLIIVLSYIFTRNNNIKFVSLYSFFAIFVSLYCLFLYLGKETIIISKNFGYEILSSNKVMEKYIIIMIMIFCVILSFKNMINKKANRLGMAFLICSVLLFIGESFLYIFNENIFPYHVISELVLIFVAYYGVNTFKRIKSI